MDESDVGIQGTYIVEIIDASLSGRQVPSSANPREEISFDMGARSLW